MPPISIDIDSTITPRFFKARPVPFALRPQLDEELDKLVAQGIFLPVRHAKWATAHIVAIAKKDGGLRICGDYRCTVNTAVKPDVYPIPTAAELFSKLAGRVVFTKLDLKQAYQQLPLDDKAANLLTINTHRGLLRARRLQFGVSTAVSIFQRFMDTLLTGIPGVQPYLDDILISGKTMEDHNTRLRAVLKCLAEAGLRLKKEKSLFAAAQVEFWGFRVDKDGIKPTCEKVEAIQKAPPPWNKSSRHYWGFLIIIAIFFLTRPLSWSPCIASLTSPLLGSGERSMSQHTFRRNSCCKRISCWHITMKGSPWQWFVMPHPMGLGLYCFTWSVMARKSPFALPPEQ